MTHHRSRWRTPVILGAFAVLGLVASACGVPEIPTAESVGYTLVDPTVAPTVTPTPEPTPAPEPTPVPDVAGAATNIEPTPSPTPTPIPQPGVSTSTIRLGIIGDINTGGGDTGGSLDGYASAAFDGVAAWAQWVNGRGGLTGREIEVVPFDSGFGLHPNAVQWVCAPETDVFALVGSKSFFDGDGIELFAEPSCAVPDFPTAALSAERRRAANTFLSNPWLSLYFQVGPLNWLAERNPGAAENAAVFLHSFTTSRIEADRLAEALDDTYTFVVREQVRYDQNYLSQVETITEAGAQSLIWTLSSDRLVAYLGAAAFQGTDQDLSYIVCIEDCYHQTFLDEAGLLAEGVYAVLPHLPFDEANLSPGLANYLAAHAELENPLAPPSTVGVQAWMAGRLFEEAVELSVGIDLGPAYDPDSLNREGVLANARRIDAWDAEGILWSNANPGGRTPSPCYVLVQVQEGAWERVHPEAEGQMDCTATNLGTTPITGGLTGGSSPPAPRPAEVDDEALVDEGSTSTDPLDQQGSTDPLDQ